MRGELLSLIEKNSKMSLKELAEQRIAEFTGTLKKYIL